MKWMEISVHTTAQACDAISEMLTGFGAGGVAIYDPEDIKKAINEIGNNELLTAK